MKRNTSKFTREEKLQIIQDYEMGNLSMREINENMALMPKFDFYVAHLVAKRLHILAKIRKKY